MKNRVLLIIIIIFFVSQILSAAPIQVKDVMFLPKENYYPELIKSIQFSRSSIYIVMYMIRTAMNPAHPVNNVLEELIKAHERGVHIEIIVDDTYKDINDKAVVKLSKYGIKIKYDPPYKITHTKLVIIDEKYVFCGSHNWTAGAFRSNNESSVKIESEYLANIYKDYFNDIDYIEKIKKPKPEVSISDTIARLYQPIKRSKQFEKEISLLLDLGKNYSVNNMFDMAIAQYKKALNLDTTNIETRYLLGEAFQNNNEKNKAIKMYKYIISNYADSSYQEKARIKLSECE